MSGMWDKPGFNRGFTGVWEEERRGITGNNSENKGEWRALCASLWAILPKEEELSAQSYLRLP